MKPSDEGHHRYRTDTDGYRTRMCQNADGSRRRVFEHVEVYQRRYGGIAAGYEVHHINGDRSDNRIENLEALDHRDHKRTHSPVWSLRDGVWWHWCRGCEKWLVHIEEFSPTQSLCRPCRNKVVSSDREKARAFDRILAEPHAAREVVEAAKAYRASVATVKPGLWTQQDALDAALARYDEVTATVEGER